MDAKTLVDYQVLYEQNEVVEALMKNDESLWEQLPEDAEILEWWLVSPWLAEWLLRSGECVLEAYGFSMVGQADQRSGHLDGCRDSGNRLFFCVALAAIG